MGGLGCKDHRIRGSRPRSEHQPCKVHVARACGHQGLAGEKNGPFGQLVGSHEKQLYGWKKQVLKDASLNGFGQNMDFGGVPSGSLETLAQWLQRMEPIPLVAFGNDWGFEARTLRPKPFTIMSWTCTRSCCASSERGRADSFEIAFCCVRDTEYSSGPRSAPQRPEHSKDVQDWDLHNMDGANGLLSVDPIEGASKQPHKSCFRRAWMRSVPNLGQNPLDRWIQEECTLWQVRR